MTTAEEKTIPGPSALFPSENLAKPKAKKYRSWHWVVLVVVGLPVAFLVLVGTNTVAHHFMDAAPVKAAKATHKPKQHKPKPTTPAYDLAGYQSAITGSDEHAFASALYALRSDINRYSFPAALTDAPRLITAANAWLGVLRSTNPPPSYQAAKQQYITAATLGRRAGKAMQDGLTGGNLALLETGQRLAARAQSALLQATPRGS